METIYIRNNRDFSKLRRLEKHARIQVILCNDHKSLSLSAISLKGFEGYLEVCLENPKRYYYYSVILEENQDTTFFFRDYHDAVIDIKNRNHIIIKHLFYQKKYEVSSFLEWKEAMKIAAYVNPLDIYVQNDIAISDWIPNSAGTILIHGNGHYLYGLSNAIQNLKNSKKVQLFDVSFYPVTQIIKVQNPYDFQKILHFSYDTVAMTLENDIVNQTIFLVDLSHFYGTLIFLGNHRKLEHVSLKNSDHDSIGLFSRISAPANFICNDLTMKYIYFPKARKDYAGCILVSRMEFSTYPGFPGKTLFYQCSINNTRLPHSKEKSGIFGGKVDEFAECISCNHSHILGGYVPFGNQNYYDEQNLDYTKLIQYNRRICYGDSRNLKKDS